MKKLVQVCVIPVKDFKELLFLSQTQANLVRACGVILSSFPLALPKIIQIPSSVAPPTAKTQIFVDDELQSTLFLCLFYPQQSRKSLPSPHHSSLSLWHIQFRCFFIHFSPILCFQILGFLNFKLFNWALLFFTINSTFFFLFRVML